MLGAYLYFCEWNYNVKPYGVKNDFSDSGNDKCQFSGLEKFNVFYYWSIYGKFYEAVDELNDASNFFDRLYGYGLDLKDMTFIWPTELLEDLNSIDEDEWDKIFRWLGFDTGHY